MGAVTKGILVFLVICFFIRDARVEALYRKLSSYPTDYPKPAMCKSDADCYKGRAKCIRGECHCQHNYVGDGKSQCDYWKKCARYMFDSREPCGNYQNEFPGDSYRHSRCLEKGKKAVCKCHDGGFGRANKPRCLMPKLDEEGRRNCLFHHNCLEVSECKMQQCWCKPGYEGNGEKCIVSAVKAECDESDDVCHASASCINKKCICKGKTIGNGREECREYQPCPKGKNYCKDSKVCLIDPLIPTKCALLNECEKQGDFCPLRSTCEKKDDGSHGCVCRSGFQIVGQGEKMACEDIDECKENQDICPDNMDCSNKEGGHECTCKSGFKESEDGTCVVKCKCGSHGECVTEDGDCNCHNGYFDEEGVCKDIDECESICKDENQQCTNNDGSYDCSCKAGYEKKADGKDECTAIKKHVKVEAPVCKCGKHEECDKKGKCKCKKGFTKKQGKCVKVPSKLKGDATSIKSSSHVTILVIALLGRLALTL